MTYPPGGTGYPPAQSPGSYGASTPSFAKSDDGESNLKLYLTIAVRVLRGLEGVLGTFGWDRLYLPPAKPQPIYSGGKSEVATARPSLTTPQEAPTGRRRLPLREGEGSGPSLL